MRKIFITLMLLLLIISLTSCNKNFIAEKVLEKVVESETNADIDISKDGNDIKVTSEEGTWQTGDDLKWPKDGMGNLPELKGKITFVSVDQATTSATVTLSEVDEKDAKEYLEQLQELGYSGMNMSDSDGLYFVGQNEQSEGATFTYNPDAKEAMVAFTTSGTTATTNTTAATSETTEKTEDIDMTDVAPWPTEFMDKLPELEGKIDSISNDGDEYYYISIFYVTLEDAKAYVEDIEKAGYTIDSSKSTDTDYFSYAAYNEDGNEVLYSYTQYGDSCDVSLELWKVVE